MTEKSPQSAAERGGDPSAWIALSRMLPSAVQRNRLIDELKNPHAAISHLHSSGKAKCSSDAAHDFAAAELALAKQHGIRVVTLSDEDYPELLKEIPDRPTHLYVQGIFDSATPRVAVVGSRRASTYGLRSAERIAAGLAEAGIIVISGLAYGIDTAAHRATLDRNGATIAVLGSGLLNIYPAVNQPLARRIVESGGAIVSEYPLQSGPESWRFPERNRIIAGWSHGVCVIEAAERSGALITARLGGEYGRFVWALPHPAGPKMPKGSFALLRDGATIIAEVVHILEDIAPTLESSAARIKTNPEMLFNLKGDRVKDALLDCIGNGDPLALEELIERTALAREILLSQLLQLEIAGRIEQIPGGLFRKRF